MVDVRKSAFGAGKYSVLLGTASVLTIAGALGAQAQPTAAEGTGAPVEEVLVTGSLIRGSAAVGVPVTTLSAKDFAETGAQSVTDMLQQLPGIVTFPMTGATGKGRSEGLAGVSIHQITGQRQQPRDLMMINGVLIAPTGKSQAWHDPSVIPVLGLERLDVLPDGASAVYGSDAVAGVFNLILKRNFSGAETMARYGRYPGGGDTYQGDVLYGHTWGSGQVTASYEYFDQESIPSRARSNITADFTPWGLDNQTLLGSSIPGVVSIGKPSTTVGTGCTNCFSLPKGQNGVGLTWASILTHPGVQNQVNEWLYSDALRTTQHSTGAITFDQRLFDGVSFFAEGYYSTRRTHEHNNAVSAKTPFTTYVIPTTNPYYPIGAPAGLQWTGTFELEAAPVDSSSLNDAHYNVGFNLDLPYGWSGKIYGAQTIDKGTAFGLSVNTPAAQAALGQTVAATATHPAWIKPSGIPYLNPFCDESAFACNPQSVIDYINGRDTGLNYSEGSYLLSERGMNFNGPVYALPGGDVKAAIGATYSTYTNHRIASQGLNSPPDVGPVTTNAPFHRNWWAVFGQVDVPIFGEANAIPLFHSLDLQGSWRHDGYSDVGGTSNPKLSFNWQPVGSLTIRGSWGTAFRAPTSVEFGASGNTVQLYNTAVGAASNSIAVSCVGGVRVAGSAAAMTGAACGSFPGGVDVTQTTLYHVSSDVGPERATNVSIGGEFAPTDFLQGLDVEVTYWKVHMSGAISSFKPTSANFNDPAYAFLYTTVASSAFGKLRDDVYASPFLQADRSLKTNLLWFEASDTINLGSEIHDGIDFNAHYDWDMSDQGFGAWDAGVSGTYYLHTRVSTGIAGVPDVDLYSVAASLAGIQTGPRYTYRARLGWTDNGWSVTGFFNYSAHYISVQTLPPAAFLAKFPNYSNLAPEFHTWDLTIGYDTGGTPTNAYLHDIDIQLAMRNVLDKHPPFQYNLASPFAGGDAGPLAYDSTYNNYGRLLELTVTKQW